MQYIINKDVYIDRDELISIDAIEHDVKSRFIRFRFLDANNVLDITYCTVRSYAITERGTKVYDELEMIDSKQGTAQLELKDSMLIEGTTKYELQIRSGEGAILSSNIFKINVKKRLMQDESAITATNDFSALDKALAKVDKIEANDVRSRENKDRSEQNQRDIATVNRNLTALDKTIGLYNIIPNSTFQGQNKNWSVSHIDNFWSGAYNDYGFRDRYCGSIVNKKIYNGDTNEDYLQSAKAFKVDKNTVYTFSCQYAVERNVESLDIYAILSSNEAGDYAKPILLATIKSGNQTDNANNKRADFTFNTEGYSWVWFRFDHNGIKSGASVESYNRIYISQVSLYKGDVKGSKWKPKAGEIYSSKINIDDEEIIFGDGNGTYSSSSKAGDLQYTTAGITNKYPALKYITAVNVSSSQTVKVKLPKEFLARKDSLSWGVAVKGYYYNTSGDFFPFYVAANGQGTEESGGYLYCIVEGVFKIQNAGNPSDVQERSLNVTLVALA